MPTYEDIGWSSYRQYEGPFYRGKHPFVLRDNPSDDEKTLAVVAATEGGHYDAINMYDGKPVLSSGLIQFIEGMGQRSVSQMIGSTVLDDCSGEFLDFVRSMGLSFAADNRKWYFFTSKGLERVDTAYEQNHLFRGGSTGEKGTWDDDSSFLAKRWAAAVASLWENPEAQFRQREFTLNRLWNFVFGRSAPVVSSASGNPDKHAQAFTAAYISFAVNNPSRADRHLCKVIDKHGGFVWKWGPDILIEILQELTFGPKIAIYPHRYNAIRPVLERLYGVELPDFAEQLKQWKEENGFHAFLSTVELQKALIALGEDLGPYGADGKYGQKTKRALRNIEVRAKLPPEFCDGMIDEHTYPILEELLLAQGKSEIMMPTEEVLRWESS